MMSFAYIIIGVVFLTSLLSGVVGMAGGMVLLAVLMNLLKITDAMFLHGLVQAFSNGSRFLYTPHHMVWSVLPLYFLGTLTATLPFLALTVLPNKGVVLTVIGIVSLIGVNIPPKWGLDIRVPWVSFTCGLIVGLTHLMAGSSGPILDVFFQKSDLNRFEIVSTKAFTQAVSHIVKLGYYLYVPTQMGLHSLTKEVFVLAGVAVAFSILGTWCGITVLHRVKEQTFRNIVPWIIRVVALVCIGRGCWELLQRVNLDGK